jgi:indolepyruvate ferredoxin oxidoreductase alpha subunit
MTAVATASAATRHLLSGNDAIARGAWEMGVRVATSYPGTPATEILETLSAYADVHTQFSVNEKVAMEVAIGAAISGARAMCSMKHVGMNVASDAFMTFTLTGTIGGMVIVVADDVGLSSSQNEQDSRFWGRFGHMPILEPADSQEAYAMTREAFALSERFATPVILRTTTRICHVKAMVTVGHREVRPIPGFKPDPQHWVMVPGNAQRRLPLLHQRDCALAAFAEDSPLNLIEAGSDRRIGFITSGPTYLHLREAFPDAPILKLGFSHPLPMGLVRKFAAGVETVMVAEETEPLMETEIKAAGIDVHGKDVLPRTGELLPQVISRAIKGFLGETENADVAGARPPIQVFPRPPTLCAACPHLAVYFALSHLRDRVLIAGDIGCYTLGAGHPWNALDTCISMGASMGVALGLDLARPDEDKSKSVVAVIGDSTFLHMGMQGLLNITYSRGNVTVLLLDNRTTGMTGGQNHPGSGRDLHGDPAPQVDFPKLVEALGVAKERIRVIDAYELPTLYKAIRQEIAVPEPSVIITQRPCTLIDSFERRAPVRLEEDRCTGCGSCTDVGCPAISVIRRDKQIKPGGQEVDLTFVAIDGNICTGCRMCAEICGANAIVSTVSISTEAPR